MILLAIASCLLFFVTLGTGIFTIKTVQKILNIEFTAGIFETFLFGLVTCFVYFNLLSFFVPVNYHALLPLLLLSLFVFYHKNAGRLFFHRIQQQLKFLFSARYLPLVLPVMALLFYFWIVPPQNIDSGEYHYISIRWYEQFRVVPGLANVHGRLGFNPASFIISAAWSFTDIAGQSLYPLNGVIVLLFTCWLIKKILLHNNSLYSFVLLLLMVLTFRIVLVNVSSPSSDLLSGIILLYCGLKTLALIEASSNVSGDYFPVIFMTIFGLTAKLTAVPSLLLLPFICFIIVKKESYKLLIKSTLAGLFIVVPWLTRNFIMTGYLLYPVPATNLFDADWAVPHNVIQLDYLFCKYGPRGTKVNLFVMQGMNLLQLTKTWYRNIYQTSISSLLITVSAFFSFMLWMLFPLLKKSLPGKIFLLWGVYYISCWVWFLNSPEHRFGLPYLALAAVLPVVALLQTISFTWKVPAFVFPVFICLIGIHYAVDVTRNKATYLFSIHDCWFRPLKDGRYFNKNNVASFSFVTLGKGVKLYLPDADHECLNADGPCMNWPYGTIKMRGKTIEDGFRNKTDEVQRYFPFVNSSH